ncbi:hypothetical protein AVEN_86861-1 [Araneus ventricosus]|uniref:Uncharacterized protein n=1 Tax=Araneus ventricosus TaxID=182803 RepID=A0A4Y2WEG0_ARAVE|nr:hypothetical protein AVEN_86861-1 [Araneus ventricosus]
MTSRYVIKGRLPPTNLHFQEKSKKHYSTVHSLCGNTIRQFPSTNHLTDFDNFYSIWKLMTSRCAIKGHLSLNHPPFSKEIEKQNFGRVPQPVQPPIYYAKFKDNRTAGHRRRVVIYNIKDKIRCKKIP